MEIIKFEKLYETIGNYIDNGYIIFTIHNKYAETYFDAKVHNCKLKKGVSKDYKEICEIEIDTESLAPIVLRHIANTLIYNYYKRDGYVEIECRDLLSNELYYSIVFCS